MANDSSIGEDRARIIAAEEADKRTGRHEETCARQYEALTKAINEVWQAIDAMRGRAWKIALALIVGLVSLCLGLVGYIYTAGL
tara:strand:+ start:8909 stop:9160 length:252 start_codon:yes stop_codon:yes gene_type:complete